MGGLLSKDDLSAIRGGYTKTTPDVQKLAAATALNEAAKRRRFTILVIVVALIIVLSIYLSLKSQYADLIYDLGVLYPDGEGTRLAYKIAIVNSYPFLRPLFFTNPATVPTVVNFYYMAINGVAAEYLTSTSVESKDTGYNFGLSCIFFPSGPLVPGSANTVYGFLEMNPDKGSSDIFTACKGSTSLWGQSGEWVNATTQKKCCPESPDEYAMDAVGAVFQYVVPVLGLLAMFTLG